MILLYGLLNNMEGSIELGIRTFMGIPIIELSVDIRKLNFFLDTGAKLSYLPQNITGNYPSLGRVEDFYPAIGRFQTDSYEIPTSLGEVSFTAKYGNLPNILQGTLTAANAQGIIGFDFFNHFKVVLDLQNNNLKYAV